jgi:hypothetical protein
MEQLMLCRRTVTALTIVLALGAPSAALAKAKSAKKAVEPCVSESTMPALNVRALQTELMVAALACSESERYNSFVETRKDELLPYAKMLQATFKGRTNAFVTKVANNSARSMDCTAAGSLFETVLSADHPQLESVASTDWASKRHGYRVCTKSVAGKAR